LDLVKKNEVYTIDITGMTHEGQGVGRIDNFTVFVDGPVEGEKVEIKIIKVKKSYAIVLEPSSDRTEPFCPSYKRCGGCSLQHMNYEASLRFKTNVVRESIRRIGGLENVVVHDTVGMEQPVNYRNKAQYPIGRYKDGIRAGFYAKRSHEIIDCATCTIQHSVSDRVRAVVKEITGEGLVRHIMTRVGFKTGEVMVVLVINGRNIPSQKKLVDRLVKEIPEIKSVVLNVNTKRTNVILGDENIVVYGRDTITDYIGEFKFNISPLSFFQVNPVQTEVLYRKALDYAQLTGKETVFDLYCGIGTISLFLSKKAKRIYGVEVAAVKDAWENAKVNGVENAEFIVGEAEKVIPEMYEKGVRADVVVVDPPRKGCDEAVLKTLVDMKPERIVYVSCNPATLEGGFEVREVQPAVDVSCGVRYIDVCVQRSWQMLTGESPVVVKVGQPLSQ